MPSQGGRGKQDRATLRAGPATPALFNGVSSALPSWLMPTKTYYLDAARTDGVTANWSLFFRNFRLDYQGRELGRLTPAELKAGREFALPDGRRLLVRLQQKFGA